MGLNLFMKIILVWIALFFCFQSPLLADEEYELVQKGKEFMRPNNLIKDYPRKVEAIVQFNSKELNRNLDAVCFIGDTGSGYDHQTQAKILLERHTFEQVQTPCKQIRHLGDIIYVTGINDVKNRSEVQKLFIGPYEKFLTAKKAPPFYLLFGNHDYYGHLEPWFDIVKKYKGRLRLPYYFYAENFNGLCFVSIDSNPLYEDGYANIKTPRVNTQRRWFSSIKRQLASCQVKILVTHHPSKAATGREMEGSLKRFFDQEVLGKFDLIMAGHDHLVAYMGKHNNTELFITGNGGKPIRDKQKKNILKGIPYVSFSPGFVKMVINRNAQGRVTALKLYPIVKNGPRDAVATLKF